MSSLQPHHRCARAEIDPDAFRHNLAVAARHASERSVWPVIKADAYGHGMETLARAVPEAAGFCVVDLDEALRLRSAGIRQPVVVLHGVHDAAALREAAAQGLTLCVHHEGQAALLEAAAEPVRAGLAGVWLKIDTGMHRLGVSPEAAPTLRRRLTALLGDAAVATMMHFATADEPGHELIATQLERFAAVPTGRGEVSICNSAALVTGLQAGDSIVRPGILLYGGSPVPTLSAEELDLRPVMTLRSRLIAVKEIPAGESVGYGAGWTAARPTRVGFVALGYGDGYPRNLPSGTPVRVGNREVTTVGRVSMDSVAVDLGDHPDAGPGTEAVLWGEGLCVDRIAAAAGTISLELLSRVTARVPRRVRGD
ncbi:MAG: alanine racemase [Gammaproteobacteria bacterium]|nr:alanine racemase [Gammaproteobacteria bacterium]